MRRPARVTTMATMGIEAMQNRASFTSMLNSKIR